MRKGGSAYSYLHISRNAPSPECGGRFIAKITGVSPSHPFPRVRGKVGMGASGGETPTPSPAHCVRKGGSAYV